MRAVRWAHLSAVTAKWLAILLLTLISLALWFVIIGLVYIGNHPSLHNQLWPHVAKWTDNAVTIERSEGRLYRGLTLHQVNIHLDDSKISIETLNWRWNLAALFSGEIYLNDLALRHAHIQLADTQASESHTDAEAMLIAPFAPLFNYAIKLRIDRLVLQDIHLQQGDSHHQLEQLNAAASWRNQTLKLKRLQLQALGYQIDSQGQMHFTSEQNMNGQLTSQVKTPLQFPAELNNHIESKLNWQLELSPSQTALDLDLDLTQPIRLSSQHRLRQHHDHWQLKSQWQNVLAELASHTLQITSLNSQLDYHPDEAQKLQLEWQALQFDDWLIARNHLDISHHQQTLHFSQHTDLEGDGQLYLKGEVQLETLHIELDAQIEQLQAEYFGVEQPLTLNSAFTWTLDNLDSRRSKLQLKHVQLQHKQTELNAQNELNLKGQISTHFDPEQQHYQLQSELDIDFAAHQGQAKLQAHLTPRLESGHIIQAQAEVADNTFQLTGHWGASTALSLSAQLKHIEQLYPALSGQAQLQLDLDGDTQTLFSSLDRHSEQDNALQLPPLNMQLELKAEQLAFADFELAELQLQAHNQLNHYLSTEWRLHARGLQQQQQTLLDQLHWSRQAEAEHLQQKLQVEHPQLSLNMALTEHNIALDQAEVEIYQLNITPPYTDLWQLEQPWRLNWHGADHISSERACLMNTPSAAQLCLQASSQQLDWQLKDWPLVDWLSDFAIEDLQIHTLVGGQGRAQWSNDEKTEPKWSLTQTLHSELIQIRTQQQGYDIPLDVHDFNLQLYADPQQLHLHQSSRIDQTGSTLIEAHLTHADLLANWQQAELDAQIDIKLNEWPEIAELDSLFAIHNKQLHLHSHISGQIEAPVHQTQAELDVQFDASLIGLEQQHLQLHLDLSETEIQAQGYLHQPASDPDTDGTTQNAASAGDKAELNISAYQLNENPRIEARLSGDSLKLLHTPFAQVFAAPQLDFKWQDQQWTLKGDVTIQNSDIDLAAMPLQDRTTISKDEVLLDMEGEPIQLESTQGQGHIDITLHFGDQVNVVLRDAQVELEGALRLVQKNDDELKAFGTVGFKRGHVMLDARNLINIDASSFYFSGLVNNPILDVNLSRQVEQTLARLNITGTASQPRFVFYSTPPMSQARVINLFIFGRTVDSDQEPNYQSQVISALYKLGLQNNTPGLSQLTHTLGIEDVYFDIRDEQTSNLILGRALTEDIYIRYIMGLGAEQSDAIQVRLRLSPIWFIESHNSDEASSVDLIFRRER